MSLLSLLTIALAASASAQQPDLQKILKLQDELPDCSVQCIRDTAADHGCTVVDLACQCSNMQPIIQDVTPCFVKAGCGLDDIANAATTVFDICEVVAQGSAGNDTEVEELTEPTSSPEVLIDNASIARGVMTRGLAIVVAAAGLALL